MIASSPWGGDAGRALEDASIAMSESWPDRIEWATRQPGAGPRADDAELERWRHEVDPDRMGQFERRLELDGLSPEQARAALGTHGGQPPSVADWLPHLRRFLAACQESGEGVPSGDDASESWLRTCESAWPRAAASVPFAHLVWPGVRAAWSSLATAEPDLVHAVGADAIDDLCLDLLSRLGEIMAPTLAAVMSAELTFGQRLLARIVDEPANPPRLSYARTCVQLAQGRLSAVLVEHPVLPSLIGTAIRQWHSATVEMLRRVRAHRTDLELRLGTDAAAGIVRVHMGAGDRHNDGRCVAVLTVGRTKVVYKPRDCRLEGLWESAVASTNAQMTGGGLRAPRVVLGGEDAEGRYGFAEFIEHQPTSTREETHRFYANAGRTLALLFALSATDCHFENLVAHGDQLILIDAEALFETRNARTLMPEAEAQGDSSNVLQVGMLPAWLWLDSQQTAVDISALGCAPAGAQRATYRGWRAINTDAMTRGRTSAPPDHPMSLPTPRGEAPTLGDWVHDVVAGFEDGYRAICSAREHGLTELLERARECSRRLIQRPTYVYARLLAQSREPSALKSVRDRGMVLERLARAYLADESGRTWPLMAAEQRALARLDVPIFEAALDGSVTRSRDVELVGWPGTDAVSTVLTRIAGLDDTDMRVQTRLIRAAFAAHAFRGSMPERPDTPSPPASRPTRAPVAQRCLDAIAGAAVRLGTSASWMTLAMLPDGERVNVQAVGSSLYDGVLGISAFLYHSGERDLADAAAAPLIDQLDPDNLAQVRRLLVVAGPGLSGAGGFLRGLRHLSDKGFVDQDRADRAIRAVVRACSPGALAQDRRLDVMSGVAGLLTPVARLVDSGRLDADDSAHARLLAVTCADRLVAQQQTDGGWLTLVGAPPLTGLAHGAAGISVALMQAAVALNEPRYAECAARGVQFETSQFDDAAGNWRDLRPSATAPFMLGWCAGAPGIGLARMRLLDLMPEHPHADQWHADLEAAATTAAAAPPLARDHLCCGNLGRAAVLALLGERCHRPDWVDASREIIDLTVARAGDGLPRSFIGADEESLAVPGLMTGLAGTGLLLSQPRGDWQAALLL